MRRAIILVGLAAALLFVSFPAAAQDSRFELFGGYTYSRLFRSTDNTTSNSNGGSFDAGFFPTDHWGLIGNFGGVYNAGFTASNNHYYNASSETYHYLFGPRFRSGTGPVSVYVQVLGGGVTRTSVVDSYAGDGGYLPGEGTIPYTFAPSETTWGVSPAIGVDARVSDHFSIRVVQAGVMFTGFPSESNHANNAFQGDLTISTGIVIH